MIRATVAVTAAFLLSSVFGLSPKANGQDYVPGKKIDGKFADLAEPFLQSHCFDCHSGSNPEGDFSLEDLGPVDEVNSGTWKAIWAQVALKEMPPADADQPEVVERLQLSDWIVQQLESVMRDKGGFRAHLDPDKGNFVDHDLLFGPLPEEIKLQPTSTAARLWRVTPQEHLVRLSDLINSEPAYDDTKPGLRSHGDEVPLNHSGELKLYFGIDRITKWAGGTVAYATAVKSVPAVLSTARDRGLENYPDFYSVNSAEATQILSLADDLVRYMAYGPLSIAKPEQITADPDTYKFGGDIRGLPSSIVYDTKIVRPLTPVYDLMSEEGVDKVRLRAAVDFLFESLTFRPPSKRESNEYLNILRQSIKKLGKEDGTPLGLSSIFLDRDALFRAELVQDGEADQHGRMMLQDWELGLAINHALCYLKPDQELRAAIAEGRMRTAADVKREVTRILADESIRKPRILQFFRDYFDYDHAGSICKDTKALAATGARNGKTVPHYRAMREASISTDRLVELILSQDQDVLKQLLTTDQLVVTKKDSTYFGRRRLPSENDAISAQRDARLQTALEEQRADFQAAKRDLAKLKQTEDPDEETDLKIERQRKVVERAKRKLDATIKAREREPNRLIEPAKLVGSKIYARVGRPSFGKASMRPERILTTAPKGERLGILTHPSWLVSHSDAMDNHAIHRGRWIRERLLGGGIPDVPITVDAMLPEEPKHTLRKRMRVTTEDYCWQCHSKMDPLGLPFEMYNHAGIYRTTELGKPVDTSGEIIDSGDPDLDGDISNAIEMIRKIAESERAEQVFVRHAFRFWMGRNETVNDRPVLQDAWRAYRDNDGSMNALVTSLLTSDAFLYRHRSE